jgi:hypothetical protein
MAISLMFGAARHRMLASMSETSWSGLDMSELKTGTVTLLLADVEGSTRLWQTPPEQRRPQSRVSTLSEAVATMPSSVGGSCALCPRFVGLPWHTLGTPRERQWPAAVSFPTSTPRVNPYATRPMRGPLCSMPRAGHGHSMGTRP